MLEWFKARVDWCDGLNNLSDTEAGRFAKALWKYALTNEEESLTGKEGMMLSIALAYLRREEEERVRKTAERSKAGRLGGRPRKAENSLHILEENPPAFECDPDCDEKQKKQTKAKKANGFFEKQKKQTKAKKANGFFEKQKKQTKAKKAEKEEEYNTTPLPPSCDEEGQNGGGVGENYIAGVIPGMTYGNYEELRAFLDDGLDFSVVRYAVDEAAAHGCRTWAYVRGVLNRCLVRGIATAEQAKAAGSAEAHTDDEKKRREDERMLARLRGDEPA